MSKPSLSQHVLAFVLAHSEPLTVAEIVGGIGHLIPAARASANGRRYVRYERKRRNVKAKTAGAPSLIDYGRRDVVQSVLRHLVAANKVRRLRPGVYARPPPRVFRAG